MPIFLHNFESPITDHGAIIICNGGVIKKEMHKFIIFGNYTDKGIVNVKDSPARLASAKKLAKEFGGEISLFYLTLGHYDIFLVCEFPSDEKAAQFTLKLGSLGNIRTTTLKAFSEEEYKNIMGR